MRNFIEAVIKLRGFGASNDVNEMLEAYYEKTHDHPFDNSSRLYGHASISLSKSVDGGNRVHISHIQTLEPGAGHGSEALKFICDLADEYHVDLDLGAKAYGRKHLSTRELIDWYARYGFVPEHYDADDLTDAELEDGIDMIRMAGS